MKVLVVGGTGVVGRPLLQALVQAGHAVVATSRQPPEVATQGAENRMLDLLDAEAAERLIVEMAPDAIIHQATALKGLGNNLRKFDRAFETTNRLRVDGTTTLIEAAHRLDTPPQIVAQSFCGWPWAPEGEQVKSEEDALDPEPAPAFRRTFAALVEMESLLLAYERGVVLRYGALYGPGTSLGPGGDQIEAIRRRGFPLVGDAGATWSFLHVADAADAAVAALTAPAGVYNVVDDTPVRIGEWLTEVAAMMSAPAPRRVPVWLARLAGGQGLVHMMTTARGSSNAKAKKTLGWTPGHPTWREGFAEALGTGTSEPGSKRGPS